jgi:mRNA interferase RelE/StbE
MPYRIDFIPEAVSDLAKLDREVMLRVIARIKWLGQNAGTISHHPLTGNLKGAFKLRAGDYRVLYDIDKSAQTITVQYIDHRSRVYRHR